MRTSGLADALCSSESLPPPNRRKPASLSTFCSLSRVCPSRWLSCCRGQVRSLHGVYRVRRLSRCGGRVCSLRGGCSLCSRRPAEPIEVIRKSLRVVSNDLYAAKGVLATLYQLANLTTTTEFYLGLQFLKLIYLRDQLYPRLFNRPGHSSQLAGLLLEIAG